MTAREQISTAPASAVHVLDPEKAKRFNARTMLIPSPLDIRAALRSVSPGVTITVHEMKANLAESAGAECTCPFALGKGWQLVALAAEEDRASGEPEITPWWRMTVAGKPSPKMPGGVENHRLRMHEDGVLLK